MMNEKEVINDLVGYTIRRDAKSIKKLIADVSKISMNNTLLIVGDTVDYFLSRDEYIHSYYIFGLPEIRVIYHPNLDYYRVVTLGFCGKCNEAESVLKRSLIKYPMDETLKHLDDLFKNGIAFQYLYC